MKKISLNVGDLLYTKGGTCIYVQEIQYTDEFNEQDMVLALKYITVRFLNGKQEGRTTWREESELIHYIEEGIYIYLPVKQ